MMLPSLPSFPLPSLPRIELPQLRMPELDWHRLRWMMRQVRWWHAYKSEEWQARWFAEREAEYQRFRRGGAD